MRSADALGEIDVTAVADRDQTVLEQMTFSRHCLTLGWVINRKGGGDGEGEGVGGVGHGGLGRGERSQGGVTTWLRDFIAVPPLLACPLAWQLKGRLI